MSSETGTLPATTARAIGVVGLVAGLVVVVYEPIAGLGGLAGGLLALGWLALGGSTRRQTLAGALFVGAVAGVVAAHHVSVARGLATAVLTSATTLVGATLGLALGGGGTSPESVRRGTPTALYAALVTGTTALGWLAVANGWTALVAWLGGQRLWGVIGTLVVVCGLLIGGVFALPLAALGRPQTRDRAVRVRRGTATLVGALGLFAVLGFWFGTAVPPFTAIGPVLASSTTFRLLLAGAGGFGLLMLCWGAFLRLAYHQSHLTGFGHVGVLGGATCATGLVAVAAVTVGGVDPAGPILPALFSVIMLLSLAATATLSVYREWLAAGDAPGVSTLLALSLLACGVTAGGLIAAPAATAGLGVIHVVTLVTIGAGLFVYRAGRVGSTIAVEVGAPQADPQLQLLHLGWTGAVVGIGLLVTGAGYWLTTVLAPSLSAPATAGVIGGLGALGGASWLLLR